MPREITSHKDAGLNEKITVLAIDEPGPGGAHHQYVIKAGSVPTAFIAFQNGGVKDVGLNGISVEALLAIAEDRLACFQAGKYACPENQEALDHVNGALKALQGRTADRAKRGVEGHLKA